MASSDVKRGQGVRRKDARPPKRDAAMQKRVDDLAASGLPYHVAVAVAAGKTDLNDALEKLAQRADVDRLMKEHDLTRALATQVVMGHADLKMFLAKRRFEQHRDTHRDRTSVAVSEAPVVLGVFGQRRVEGCVTEGDAYQITITGKEGSEVLHKLQLKFAYAPDDYKRVKKGFRKDKALSAAPKAPAERPQDRYTCSDKRLFGFVDQATPVDVMLLEGEIISGTVVWFGRFEFGLDVKGGAIVTIFRHALHRITPQR